VCRPGDIRREAFRGECNSLRPLGGRRGGRSMHQHRGSIFARSNELCSRKGQEGGNPGGEKRNFDLGGWRILFENPPEGRRRNFGVHPLLQ